jgi:hypothetical protein
MDQNLLSSSSLTSLLSKKTLYKSARGRRAGKQSAPSVKREAWRKAAETWCRAGPGPTAEPAPHKGAVPFGRLRRFRPMNNKRPLKKKSALPKPRGAVKEPMELKRLRVPRAGDWDLDYPWRRGEPPNFEEEVMSDCADEKRVHLRRRLRRTGTRRKRRHSLAEETIRRRGRGSLNIDKELSMLHDLRSYFDPMYRIFLVKRALRQHCEWHHGSAELGLRMLYNEINTDRDDHINHEELKAMVKLSGIRVRKQELVDLWGEIDIDKGGSIDYGELKAWLVDDGDAWLAERRQLRQDSCNDVKLLARESLKYDVGVQQAIEAFWLLVDEDKNGKVSLREYVQLSIHLQQAANPEAFDMTRAKATALREWEFDSQGYSFLDRNRFTLSFFQMADAWASAITSAAYTQFLNALLDATTADDLDDGGGGGGGGPSRRWLWDKYGDEKWSKKAAKHKRAKARARARAARGGSRGVGGRGRGALGGHGFGGGRGGGAGGRAAGADSSGRSYGRSEGDEDCGDTRSSDDELSALGSPGFGSPGSPNYWGDEATVFLQQHNAAKEDEALNPDGGMVNPLVSN